MPTPVDFATVNARPGGARAGSEVIRVDGTSRVGQQSLVTALLSAATRRFREMTPVEVQSLASEAAITAMDQEAIPPSDRAELLRRMARVTKQHARRFRSKSEPRDVTSGVSDWLSAVEPWADRVSQTETCKSDRCDAPARVVRSGKIYSREYCCLRCRDAKSPLRPRDHDVCCTTRRVARAAGRDPLPEVPDPK